MTDTLPFDEYDDDDLHFEDDDDDEYDVCYECTGYGDDYFINDDGELESSCSTCPFNEVKHDN